MSATSMFVYFRDTVAFRVEYRLTSSTKASGSTSSGHGAQADESSRSESVGKRVAPETPAGDKVRVASAAKERRSDIGVCCVIASFFGLLNSFLDRLCYAGGHRRRADGRCCAARVWGWKVRRWVRGLWRDRCDGVMDACSTLRIQQNPGAFIVSGRTAR